MKTLTGLMILGIIGMYGFTKAVPPPNSPAAQIESLNEQVEGLRMEQKSLRRSIKADY